MTLSRRHLLGAFGGALAARGTLAASPAQAAEFYRGKTLTLVVGFAPGGGVDTNARLVARNLVRFIPGQPGLVVQNLEGAGGLVGANHIYQRAAADGLTVAVPGRSWFVEGVVKSPGVNFDPTRFSWIGSPGAVNSNIYVRASTGITSFEDFKSYPRPVSFGALSSSTTTALIPGMLAANGLPIKVVTGYGATARVLLALEQGEVDAVFTVEDSFSHRQDLLRRNIVIPIMRSIPGEPALPLVRDALPASAGPVLKLVLALDSFGLPVVAPPNIPADRLAILRDAFMAMADDADFRAEAEKLDQPIGTPLSGSELQRRIDDLAAAATPEVVTTYKHLGGAK